MKCRYLKISSTYEDVQTHGIAAAVTYDGCTVILESFADLCDDEAAVVRLVRLCNELELDPIHLQDVVDDFMATV